MWPTPGQYGVLLVAMPVPVALLGWVLREARQTPCNRWITLSLVGIAGWSVSLGLPLLVGGPTLSLVSRHWALAFSSVTVAGWLVVAWEFVRQRPVPAGYVLGLLAVPLVGQFLLAVDPVANLGAGPPLAVGGTGVAGPWLFLFEVFTSLALLASGVALIYSYVRHEGRYRAQTAVLLVGWIVPVVAWTATRFDAVLAPPVDPSPVGFLVGAGVWVWGIGSIGLFQIRPVARQRVFDALDEGVVIVNGADRLVDVNEAARAMFEVPGDPVGRPVREFLPACPAAPGEQRSTVVEADGRDRHLSLTRTDIPGEGASGDVIVCQDVTRRARYERNLELLKQVFGRVFRHDVRNDLNVVRAHGEVLSDRTEGEAAEHARTIVRTSDELIETSRKARSVEKLVEVDRDRYEIHLGDVVEDVVAWATERFPDATITHECHADPCARADDEVALAVRCLVENAVVHNDAADVRVHVSADETADGATLTVADNGPGLEPTARSVFDSWEVDPLSHSSGLGLWAVNWVVRNSAGSVEVRDADPGTEITLTFERVCGPADA